MMKHLLFRTLIYQFSPFQIELDRFYDEELDRPGWRLRRDPKRHPMPRHTEERRAAIQVKDGYFNPI